MCVCVCVFRPLGNKTGLFQAVVMKMQCNAGGANFGYVNAWHPEAPPDVGTVSAFAERGWMDGYLLV